MQIAAAYFEHDTLLRVLYVCVMPALLHLNNVLSLKT